MNSKFTYITIASIVSLALSVSFYSNFGLNALELLGAFAHFNLLLSCIILVVSALKKCIVSALTSLLAAVLSFCAIAPALQHAETSNLESSFSVIQTNLYHYNTRYEEAMLVLLSADFDVVSIQELNSKWKDVISEQIIAKYPYQTESAWDSCCYGIGLYSKYPILDQEVLNIDRTPCIIATIDVNGKMVRVVSLHTRPPIFPNETDLRNHQLAEVADLVKDDTIPTLVIGDFNVVSWDNTLTEFLDAANLSRAECGFQATYPMEFGLPLIPIDHITFNNLLTQTSCGSLAMPGSDHKAIHASFSFKE